MNTGQPFQRLEVTLAGAHLAPTWQELRQILSGGATFHPGVADGILHKRLQQYLLTYVVS